MFKTRLILVAVVVIAFVSCQTSRKVEGPLTIAFYNTENLFDTIDTPNKFDEEFTPSDIKNWNTEKYEKKLHDLARVVRAIDSVKLPALLGVAEIENDIVLNDLVAQDALKKANYQIVWQDGPDFRGIDCALLYQPAIFKLESFESLPVTDPDELDFLTRDVLYVKGKIGGEVFHVFVNHWPSRRGGEVASAPKRVLAANVVRKKVNGIFELDPKANIIIMGDMNDEPGNMSLSDVLMAIPNKTFVENNQLVNLMYDDFENGLGSYNYQNDWNMIDNMVISGALINKKKGLKSKLDNGFIFHQPFMEFKGQDGQISPNRTYGRSYYGGVSDHFPIYMILE
ncbi:MAG: endonuclease/exonuclease/phosphatase family protein [Prolixibacteraceae bacterium]